jgi:transposase
VPSAPLPPTSIGWLVQCGIKTVAMESTGVYWIPLHEVLEERGLEVVLVNVRQVHNVRGRKSDVQDCQWLQELHSVGLLQASFRPAGEIVALRSYVRHRQSLVEAAAQCIHRMQKALTQMNLKLHHVLSDLTGVTGMAIVRDILAGVRDPQALAAHRDGRCKASEQDIAAALTGHYRPEHLFALRQNFAAFEFHQRQIAQCDQAIEAQLASLADSRLTRAAGGPPARQAQQERTARGAARAAPSHYRRRRPQPDRWHQALRRAAIDRRNRH